MIFIKLILKDLKKIIENIDITNLELKSTKKIEIPVCCEDSFSLDIEKLEKKLLLNKEKNL